MYNIAERRELKRICREVRYENNLLDTLTYREYNMTILSIMAVCLLGRIIGKEPYEVGNYYDFNNQYIEEIQVLTSQFPSIKEKLDRLKRVPFLYVKKICEYTRLIDGSYDNILAWAYQYLKYDKEKEVYGSSLKEGKKIGGDSIAPATQFFTEDYMVRYLVNQALSGVFENKKDLCDIRIIDPACGGGNFLIYALDVLYQRFSPYTDSKLSLLKIIVENVLSGYDIDSDLSEIAAISLYLKAISYTAPEFLEIAPSIYTTSLYLDEVGSLRRNSTQNGIVRNVSNGSIYSIQEILKDHFFDVIITNPPFMGKRNMGRELLNFLKDAYPLSKGDLCIAFILRCIELTNTTGIIGIVNQTSWMYLSSYTEIRKQLLEEGKIREVVDLGSNSFYDINGEKTTVALTVLSNKERDSVIKFMNLKMLSLEEKEEALLHGKVNNDVIFNLPASQILKNEGYVFQYSVSASLSSMLRNMQSYKEFATPMQGTSTGDNKLFIDYAWNRINDPDWVLVSKGGGYSKWSGLNHYKVKWGKDAEYIKLHPGSAVRNLKHMNETELVYSDTGTLGLSVRVLKEDQVFIASGPGIRIQLGSKFAHLAYLNSRTASYFLKLLSPKFTIAAGYIGQLPVTTDLILSKQLEKLGQDCLKIKESYLSRKLSNQEYVEPNFRGIKSLEDYVMTSIKNDLHDELQRLEKECAIEMHVQEYLGLSKEDILQIEETVGAPSYKIKTNKKLQWSPIETDKNISRLLNESCQYVSRGKKRYGVEGVLEDLAQTLLIHPEKVYSHIIEQLPHLHEVKQKYIDDLLHKILLMVFNLRGHNFEYHGEISVNEAILGVESKVPFLDKRELESWLMNRFEDIHIKVFYGSPIVKLLKTSNSAVLCSVSELATV
ncbi:Eco57I restriction-modification methylase domain-containing protein [Paenibacillus polymyxa]|uniref:Eco57I restriction-modification methylase domain-containing protein n=1 Tax=Paenibacillus polymyxa TaxID=1406 RepID=UPI00129AA9D7|nr:N-6 DNA methylase [Paenibacillus polymyxa]KAE8561750.1 hypothetical protein BJH92_02045 [Paenibacillus polymyxa]MCJ1221125.1 BREX-1 system adenine-specific DNA-methyltransferase PglX [Paenibacillus polymyxa]